MSYDGLVLDHDGVLMRMAASETITDAVVAAFAAAGVTDPRPADIDKLTVGVDPEDVRAVAERHGLDPATLWEYREAAVHEALQDATVAGAKGPYDDVGVLRDLDCPLGIASNNQSRTVSYMLDHHDLSDLFVAVHARESTFDSLHRKKPNPELLTAAVERLDAATPLYVGDSETDIQAARRAGVDVAFLRRSHNADRTLTVTPTYDLAGLDEVAALLG